jgi:hypothetical protein
MLTPYSSLLQLNKYLRGPVITSDLSHCGSVVSTVNATVNGRGFPALLSPQSDGHLDIDGSATASIGEWANPN